MGSIIHYGFRMCLHFLTVTWYIKKIIWPYYVIGVIIGAILFFGIILFWGTISFSFIKNDNKIMLIIFALLMFMIICVLPMWYLSQLLLWMILTKLKGNNINNLQCFCLGMLTPVFALIMYMYVCYY